MKAPPWFCLLRGRHWAARHGLIGLRHQSRLKLAFITLFFCGLWLGLYALFLEGFQFLGDLGGVGLILIYRLLGLFFWGLGVLLTLSAFITACGLLYRGRETTHLLTIPIPRTQLLLFKALETAGFASWAFFLIVIPFMAAYARYQELGPELALWTLLFAVPFVLCCAGLGTLAAVVLVRWLPRRRWVLLLPFLAAAALLAPPLWESLRAARSAATDPQMLVLARMVPGLRLAARPYWPSWWLTEGINALNRGQWARGAAFWLLLSSHTLLLGLLLEQAGRRLLYPAWLRAQSPPAGRIRRPWLSRLPAAPRWLPRDATALIAKDLRCVLRDPAQWAQGLIFFVLLGFYFLNLRLLHYHQLEPVWRNLIVFLNVFSVAAVMCSFGARFLYPQLSLEGQAIWLLGLAPGGLLRAYRLKFRTAATALLLIGGTLTFLSTRMLAAGPLLSTLAFALVATQAIAIAGCSIGLGAVFLDLRQTETAAIVSSFGGTLNLILNLAILLLTTLPAGMLFHLRLAWPEGFLAGPAPLGLLAAWLALVGCAAAGLPLALGRRALARREF